MKSTAVPSSTQTKPVESPSIAVRLDERLKELGTDKAKQDTLEANKKMIARAVRGQGPDDSTPKPELGARMVANISGTHIPAFCLEGYKNAYDLGKFDQIDTKNRIGPNRPPRLTVDQSLEEALKINKEQTYFGAAELNGTGVRFYGDFCLVLALDGNWNPHILESNSYDLVRDQPVGVDLVLKAQSMAGTWKADLANIAALKTLATRVSTERRLTTGQISDSLLQDEDYVEVLKQGPFGPGEMQEVRTSAADAAAESAIEENSRLGPCGSLAALQWRKHRRSAIQALEAVGISVRIVTTSGRVR